MNLPSLLEKQTQLWIVIIGIAFMGYGIYFFLDLQSIENNHGIVHMKKVFLLIYNIGGKYAILALFEILGIIALISGIKQLKNNK